MGTSSRGRIAPISLILTERGPTVNKGNRMVITLERQVAQPVCGILQEGWRESTLDGHELEPLRQPLKLQPFFALSFHRFSFCLF